jgi:acetyl esterase/lipase
MATALGIALGGCGSGSPPPHQGDQGAGLRPDQRRDAGPVAAAWLTPPRPIAGLRQRTVGHGIEGAAVLWRRGEPVPPRRTVVFLHGWQAVPPWFYAGWLRHLASAGNTIVYPVMRRYATPPERLADDTLAGIAAGLHAVRADPEEVVVIGLTSGAVVALDYAARARAEGLPPPRGVFGVFPGRFPPGGEIPLADLAAIPRSTRLLLVAGPGDPIPDGDAEARRLLARASPRSARPGRIRSAPARAAGGRPGAGGASRREFWLPADRLFAAARADPEGPSG